MTASSRALFLLTVLIWGSTWIAIKLQTGTVAPEASVAYRFLGAALILLVACRLAGIGLRLPWRAHGLIALQGVCLFCLNYVPIYAASESLTSGLVAVGFSTVAVFSIAVAAIVERKPVDRRLAAGAAAGLAGLALIFWPELQATAWSGAVAGAAGLTLFAAATAAAGTVVAAANRRAGIAVLPLNALGMLYGGLATAAHVSVGPADWGWDGDASYALSLLYLILVGTIAGFWCFLTVVGRIGPERASFIPVLFPVVALAISTVAEGYAWPPLAVVGVGLVLAGNALALARPAGAKAGLPPGPKLWSRPVRIGAESRFDEQARTPLGRTTA